MVNFRLIVYLNTNISSGAHEHTDEEEQCMKHVAYPLLGTGWTQKDAPASHRITNAISIPQPHLSARFWRPNKLGK